METFEQLFLRISNALIGTWQSKRNQGIMYEEWRREDASTLRGRAWIEKDGKEYPGETLVVQIRDDIVQYIPTVHNHNDGRAIPFTLTNVEENSFVFENLAHDFPQRIVYTAISQNSLYAYIEGTTNGVEKKVEFPFLRVV